MSDGLNPLVETGPTQPARPAVTTEQFRAITCNQCGMCCEEIPAPQPPEVIAAGMNAPSASADERAFLAGLEPVARTATGWMYRCRHFSRDEHGLGRCAIYERRPSICRDFPYGWPVTRWSSCSWYVRIVDGGRTSLPLAD